MEEPLTPTLSPQERGEGAVLACRANEGGQVGRCLLTSPREERGEGVESLPLRNPVDLCELFRAERPVDRLDVLLDLLDAGGAGDHA
jgi:hypothetical protein